MYISVETDKMESQNDEDDVTNDSSDSNEYIDINNHRRKTYAEVLQNNMSQ